MAINKKRQPCSGIIQNMITFRKKIKIRDTHGHSCTHPTVTSVCAVPRGCAVFLAAHVTA